MAKLNLSDITSGYKSADAYNNNNALTEAAVENTLSRDGTTPNEMNADIDMNAFDVDNVGTVTTNSLILNGEVVSSSGTLTGGLDATEVAYTPTNPPGPLTTLQDALDNDYLRNDADQTFTGDMTVVGVSIADTFEPTVDTSAGDAAAMGYTVAEGLILTGQGLVNDVTIKNDADAIALRVPTGTTNVVHGGELDNSLGKIITNGHIEFPAVQNASADVNTLDDYEEGEWTPLFLVSPGTILLDPDDRTLQYTKVGGVVHVSGKILSASLSGTTGLSTILMALPFAARTGSTPGVGDYFAQVLNYNLLSLADGWELMINMASGSATATIRSVLSPFEGDQLITGAELYFNFTYQTDA